MSELTTGLKEFMAFAVPNIILNIVSFSANEFMVLTSGVLGVSKQATMVLL